MTARAQAPDTALASVDRVLLAWALAPLAPVRLPLAEAEGLVLAEDLVASSPAPPHAVALRPGWAIAADETAGASPYSPVLLNIAPARVAAGDPLPSGADAVLPPDAVDLSSGFPEAVAGAFPGEGARRTGGDLSTGAVIAPAGRRLSTLSVAAAQLAGLDAALVRAPQLAIHAPPGCPIAAFLSRAARERGARVAADAEADLVLRVGDPGGVDDEGLIALGLALRPGETALPGLEGGTPLVVVPPRLDAALGLFTALVEPALGALAGAAPAPASVAGALTKKISSQVGFTEVALLRATKGALEPVAAGDLTLSAMLRADAYLLVPPESEGFAAGERVEAHPLPGASSRPEEP